MCVAYDIIRDSYGGYVYIEPLQSGLSQVSPANLVLNKRPCTVMNRDETLIIAAAIGLRIFSQPFSFTAGT